MAKGRNTKPNFISDGHVPLPCSCSGKENEESNEKTNRRRPVVVAAERKMSWSWKNKFWFHCFYGRLAAMREKGGRGGGRGNEEGRERDKTRQDEEEITFCCFVREVGASTSFSLFSMNNRCPTTSSPAVLLSLLPPGSRILKGLLSSCRSQDESLLKERTMQFLTNLLSVLRHPIMNLSSPLMY